MILIGKLNDNNGMELKQGMADNRLIWFLDFFDKYWNVSQEEHLSLFLNVNILQNVSLQLHLA